MTYPIFSANSPSDKGARFQKAALIPRFKGINNKPPENSSKKIDAIIEQATIVGVSKSPLEIFKNMLLRLATPLQGSSTQQNLLKMKIAAESLRELLNTGQVQSNSEHKEVINELLLLYQDVHEVLSRNPKATSFNGIKVPDQLILVSSVVHAVGYPSEVVFRAGKKLGLELLGGTEQKYVDMRTRILEDRQTHPENYGPNSRQTSRDRFIKNYEQA